MCKAIYSEVCKWNFNFWNKTPKDIIEKAFLKAEIFNFSQKSTVRVPTSSNMFFKDTDSSNIDELLPFKHAEMFHTDNDDEDIDGF